MIEVPRDEHGAWSCPMELTYMGVARHTPPLSMKNGTAFCPVWRMGRFR